MTIASLVLAYVRFVPAMDGIDFREASIETTREYASRLTGYTLRELVNVVAISRYAGDTQKALVVLDCLYNGRDWRHELRELNVNREIQEIRMFAMKERRELEKEIELEIEKLNRKEVA